MSQSRNERRAVERRAAKLARKAAQKANPGVQTTPVAATLTPSIDEFSDQFARSATPDVNTPVSEFKPAISEAQLAANRANAQLSTGPTSPEGRERSSQNRITHGLSGAFRLLGWEDPEQFKELATSLYNEHKPANDSERRLVDSMAQHFWLMQRALTLQDQLLIQPELDHKTFSLYLRYQTTNERAYYRAKREFAAQRKEQSKQQNGFESQKRQQEAHDAKIRLTNARAETAEIENFARSTMEVPLPGNIRVPFEDLTAAFRLTLQNLNKELANELTKKNAA